jgi:hypothetical protein
LTSLPLGGCYGLSEDSERHEYLPWVLMRVLTHG